MAAESDRKVKNVIFYPDEDDELLEYMEGKKFSPYMKKLIRRDMYEASNPRLNNMEKMLKEILTLLKSGEVTVSGSAESNKPNASQKQAIANVFKVFKGD